jgi:hypothetical protein
MISGLRVGWLQRDRALGDHRPVDRHPAPGPCAKPAAVEGLCGPAFTLPLPGEWLLFDVPLPIDCWPLQLPPNRCTDGWYIQRG